MALPSAAVRKGTAPTLVALATLLGAVVAAFVLPSPATIRGPRAARAFIAAWDRSRHGTFVVESRFERVLTDGRRFTGDTFLAQRPPDRLVVGLGPVEGRVDGRGIDCATEPSGGLRCFPGAPVGDYEDDVAGEIRLLRSYVEGERPLYAASWDGEDCFALVLVLDVPAAPYGTSARFCFDPATGAQVVLEVRRPEGRDLTDAISVRGTVRDDDFNLPTDAGELPG